MDRIRIATQTLGDSARHARLPKYPPPLDQSYLDWVINRMENGWCTVESAMAGIHARDPYLSTFRKIVDAKHRELFQ